MKRILSLLLVAILLTFAFSANAATINQAEEVKTMLVREIPEGSVEIQTGLWLYEYQITFNGEEKTLRQLFSAEGYCFYDLADEYCDNEGNIIPEEEVQPTQRLYYQWMGLAISQTSWTYEQLNAQYISVPVQDGYEIVSVSGNHETV